MCVVHEDSDGQVSHTYGKFSGLYQSPTLTFSKEGDVNVAEIRI